MHLRIAYLVNQYPAPSQTFIRREIKALEAQGHEVLRFALRRGHDALVDPADRAEEARTRYAVEAGMAGLLWAMILAALTRPRRFLGALALTVRTAYRSDRPSAFHVAYLAEACVLRRWLVEQNVDHLHVHFGTNSADVAMLANVLGGPAYSIMIHGPEDFDRAICLSLGEKVRRAAFVTTISSFARSQLFRWCDAADWGKIEIVRCGLGADLLDAPPTAPPTERRMVNVGRLCEQKGQILLIEAAAILARQGVEFELVLVGDGPFREAIESAIAEAGVGDRVRLAGWATNAAVAELLQNSRGLVLASFAEGLPVVIMESMALGRPVVSSWVAGIPELIVDGDNGWLVPPGDAEQLARGMLKMLSAAPDELERMGLSGRASVARLHDASTEAAVLEGHIQRTVMSRRAETDGLSGSTPREYDHASGNHDGSHDTGQVQHLAVHGPSQKHGQDES